MFCTTVLVVRYITSCDFYPCGPWRST